MSDLAGFLSARGYQRLPLTRSVVGHFHTAGTLNGRPVEVLVDTGAASTVASMSVIRSLGLRTEWLNRDAGGAGGALDQYRVDGADLRLGSFVPRLRGLIGLDFDPVNATLRAQGSAEVDVILGVDVFDAHAAVIDYPTSSLFLKTVPVEDASVGAGSP